MYIFKISVDILTRIINKTRTKNKKETMNDTKVTESSEENSWKSLFWPFLEYALNKYMPIIMIGFITFYSFGYIAWEPYFILALVLFSCKFNFRCIYKFRFIRCNVYEF